MGRIAFGSPEAQAVLAADKKRQQEEERKAREKKWEAVVSFDGDVTVTVVAEDEECAKEEAIFVAINDYFDHMTAHVSHIKCKGKAY